MVRGAPVPAFPAVGIVVHLGMADRVHETEIGRQVIADVAPGVVRAVRRGDGARAILRLHALDLVGDDGDRLVPTDALVARDAAVLRIALALRIEVDALHGMEQAVGRVDDRFEVLSVRRQRGLARRRVGLAARLDGPRAGVALVEVDRRQAHDLAVLDVDEDRAAVGHAGIARLAAGELGAVFPAQGLGQQDGAGEPGGQLVRPVHLELEVLDGVDLLLLADRRGEQLRGDRGVLERQIHVRARMNAGARAHRAVAEGEPAAHRVVHGADLRDEGLFLQAFAEGGIAPGAILEQQVEAGQDQRKPQLCKHRTSF